VHYDGEISVLHSNTTDRDAKRVDSDPPYRLPPHLVNPAPAHHTRYKIVFFSSSLSLPTTIAESLRLTFFPLNWQFTYIPVCPEQLCDVISSPMPFCIGLPSHLQHAPDLIPDDVVCVHLEDRRLEIGKVK
jgi:hypothetical protein